MSDKTTNSPLVFLLYKLPVESSIVLVIKYTQTPLLCSLRKNPQSIPYGVAANILPRMSWVYPGQ